MPRVTNSKSPWRLPEGQSLHRPTRQPVPASAPASASWWCGLSRDDFYGHLSDQRKRIESSTLGQASMLVTPPRGAR
jgi:hypothetical protein